jgi:hypothetical protein
VATRNAESMCYPKASTADATPSLPPFPFLFRVVVHSLPLRLPSLRFKLALKSGELRTTKEPVHESTLVLVEVEVAQAATDEVNEIGTSEIF